MIGTGSSLLGYTLFKEDIERVREAGGPLAELPDLSGVRDNMAVAVVEKDGEIVAYWCLFMALHAEPLWIREDARRHPVVVRKVVEVMLEEAGKHQEPAVYCSILQEAVAEYAERLGFRPVPGVLWEKKLEET